MQIHVSKTTNASPNGVTVHRYKASETCGPDSDPPMPADLVAVCLAQDWGEEQSALIMVSQ